ncbi:hypothetical protein ACFCXK_08875 [Streptomyces sp. NPDC056269]|uniref:hypothetical protein n=1 Tax=Streptomyces sp. NPDC056269 TaxID=3345768 RepID=UPI0035D8A004
MGRVILATEPMATILTEAGAHVTAAHPDTSTTQLLEVETAGAGVFRGPDPRRDPTAWVAVLNAKMPADF